MKLSKQTIEIFKNYSTINSSLAIKAGSTLKTMNENQNIMSTATISESFPIDFGIYDLVQFLSALSLFENPELDFQEKYVDISEGKQSIRYYYADKAMVKPIEKKIVLQMVDVEFSITRENLADVLRAAQVLALPEIVVTSDNGNIGVKATSTKNKTSNFSSIDVGAPTKDTFNIIFKAENLKLIPGTYKVEIWSKGITKFTNKDIDLVYFVTSETHSTYVHNTPKLEAVSQ